MIPEEIATQFMQLINSTLQYVSHGMGSTYGDGWTELGRKFAEDLNLCTSDKQNINYLYENVSMDYYIDSKRMLPTADEIRPVNVAVRYYIKAK